MGEDRIVVVEDKRGTEDCPDLFANIVMKRPNTMATVSGNSHKKVSVQSLSEKEARQLHQQLGMLFDKIKLEPTDTVSEDKDEVKPDFSDVVPEPEVKDASTENVESNKGSETKVGTQEQTKETNEEGSVSEGKQQIS